MGCNIENCDDDTHAKGMCKRHYARWIRGMRGAALLAPLKTAVGRRADPESKHQAAVDGFGLEDPVCGEQNCWETATQVRAGRDLCLRHARQEDRSVERVGV